MIVEFDYLNHRGEMNHYRVEVDSIEYLADPPKDYYPQPGWFLSGTVAGKGRRTFDMNHIILPDVRQNYKLLNFGMKSTDPTVVGLTPLDHRS